jgi:hypothetical protein
LVTARCAAHFLFCSVPAAADTGRRFVVEAAFPVNFTECVGCAAILARGRIDCVKRLPLNFDRRRGLIDATTDVLARIEALREAWSEVAELRQKQPDEPTSIA